MIELVHYEKSGRKKTFLGFLKKIWFISSAVIKFLTVDTRMSAESQTTQLSQLNLLFSATIFVKVDWDTKSTVHVAHSIDMHHVLLIPLKLWLLFTLWISQQNRVSMLTFLVCDLPHFVRFNFGTRLSIVNQLNQNVGETF